MKRGKLRIIRGGRVAFWCPGCKQYHGINADGSELPTWSFNGDYDQPTFSPSIRVEKGHFPDASDICHSFITGGKIQFLSDCTHKLAGKTVNMVEPK